MNQKLNATTDKELGGSEMFKDVNANEYWKTTTSV